MPSPKLRSPDQPRLVQFLLGLYESLASLRLAVVVIGACAVVLAWATIVESRQGTEAARFGIYGAWWFWGLNALLGINVLCAALIRFPWRRSQIGFLLTHTGILVLLVGCLATALKGIDAQLPVLEGSTGHTAFEKSQHFELKIDGRSPAAPGDSGSDPAAEDEVPAPSDPRSRAGTIRIPFASGPFNWADYREKFFFPWRLAHRDRGVVFDREGIKLEVLDYFSDSTLVPGEVLELRVKSGPSADASGGTAPSADPWTSVPLDVRSVQNPHSPNRRMGLGSRRELAGGTRIVFWVAGSREETEAFRDSRPAGPLGPFGQLVLHAGGKRFPVAVDKLQQQTRLPLGDTGLQIELIRYDPDLLGVVLRVLRKDKTPGRMLLLADAPEYNRQDNELGVFGTYWFDAPAPDGETEADPAEEDALRDPRRPRIDVIQGADRKLYYRTWNAPGVEAVGELPTDETRVVAFPQSDAPVTLYVESFVPHDGPGWNVRPVAFERKKDRAFKQRRARLQLTVDGNTEEFWLEGLPADPFSTPPTDEQRKVVAGDRRRVTITMPLDQVALGFQVYLHKFERKLDPGTSQASYYASLVDFLNRDDEEEILRKKVLITLNDPARFADRRSGRTYRIYQEAYRGPWKPGDPIFDQLSGGTSTRDELFLSWLTVNYDPGRGLKYSGSLLIIVGVAVVFYMRGYLFRRRKGRRTAGL